MWDKEHDKKEANVISQNFPFIYLHHRGFLISSGTRFNASVSGFVRTSITCLLTVCLDCVNEGLG